MSSPAIILIFLWHFPSALVPMITLPVAFLISFIPMRAMGITSNIMSLGGIAIAIGELVDAAIVVVEQTHKKLEEWEKGGRVGDHRRVVVEAVKEVGGPSFYSLLVIAVSFLPILALEAQEGRLFKPLAYTKNLAMIVAAVLAITLDPALRMLFTHVGAVRLPAALARADRECRSHRQNPFRRAPSDFEVDDQDLRTCVPLLAPAQVRGDPWRDRACGSHRTGL